MAKAGVDVTYTDKGLQELFDNIRELGKLRVTVGYQGKDATKRDGPKGATLSAIARYNEFGTKYIPARPFMRRAVKKSGQKLADVAALEFADVAEGKADPVDAMAEVGKVMLDGVHDQIDTTRAWATVNAPSTIAKKGAAYPPLEAGHDRLRKDASWAVRENRMVVKEGK